MKKIFYAIFVLTFLLPIPASLVFAQTDDLKIEPFASNKYEVKSGEQVDLRFKVIGGTSPYNWVSSPSFSGVDTSVSQDHTTFGIKGTISILPGHEEVEIRVKDGTNKTATHKFILTVTGQAPVPPGGNPPPGGTTPPPGQTTTNPDPAALGASFYNPLGSTDNIPKFIVKITRILLTLTGMLSVLMIVVGGIRYVTSAGVSAQAEGAKRTITYAIIGLAVSILSFAIVQIVANTLVK